MPNWCRSRISATGPHADVFKRDFMASYNRTKCNEECSLMDGVFATKTGLPAQMVKIGNLFQSLGMSTMRAFPGEPANAPIFWAQAVEGSNAVEFASKWEPVHDLQHLTAITCAYPSLNITYDYAERGCEIFGRWNMQGGAVKRASKSEIEAAKLEPAYKKLIDKSG